MRIRSSALLIVIVSLVAGAGTGVSGAVIDSYLPGSRSQSNQNDGSFRYAQSFVAGSTDSIGSIGLIVEYAGSDAGVDIYAVAPDADTPTGNSLAHAVITQEIGQVPDGDGFTGDPLDDMSYFVLSDPFAVQAGEKYAIVFTSDFNFYLSSNPGHANADLSVSLDNGQSWQSYGGDSDIDAAFIVSTPTPEPTSIALLAVGALALRRRAR